MRSRSCVCPCACLRPLALRQYRTTTVTTNPASNRTPPPAYTALLLLCAPHYTRASRVLRTATYKYLVLLTHTQSTSTRTGVHEIHTHGRRNVQRTHRLLPGIYTHQNLTSFVRQESISSAKQRSRKKRSEKKNETFPIPRKNQNTARLKSGEIRGVRSP